MIWRPGAVPTCTFASPVETNLKFTAMNTKAVVASVAEARRFRSAASRAGERPEGFVNVPSGSGRSELRGRRSGDSTAANFGMKSPRLSRLMLQATVRITCPSAAFARMELLAVIAVVFLLLGLAVSALAHNRQLSARVICLNNLRQIGISTQLYIQDHSSRYPRKQVSGEVVPGTTLEWNAQYSMGGPDPVSIHC